MNQVEAGMRNLSMISIVMICETEWMIVMRVVAEMDFRDRVVGSRENVIELEIST